MGKTSGFDLSFTTLSSLLMFALPGQVVLMEMMLEAHHFWPLPLP
jgi:hypothetical protein